MPARRTTPQGYDNAHRLRKTPTASEATLWNYLRGRKLQGESFRRQHAIGRYVVDFCCLRQRLIVELDGSPHVDQKERDSQRDAELRALGYRVLRFWDHQLQQDVDGVLGTITDALDSR